MKRNAHLWQRHRQTLLGPSPSSQVDPEASPLPFSASVRRRRKEAKQQKHTGVSLQFASLRSLQFALDDPVNTGDMSASDERVVLPPAVSAYLSAQGIDTSVYDNAHLLPRFVRVRPGRDPIAIAAELSSELGVDVVPVPYLPSFLSMPPSVPGVVHTAPSLRGDCIGMDVSSGVCVAALMVQPHHHVLDMCCAPGAKLAMLADLLDARGSLTAVDSSTTRMASCKTLLSRFKLVRQPVPRLRMSVADGRTFTWEAPAASPWDAAHPKRPYPNANFTHCHAELAVIAPQTGQLYDRVLVDAPCTHDGSMRHMVKSFGGGRGTSDEAAKNFLQGQDLDGLHDLQAALLLRGFELLRPGGRLVYSTCSLTKAQNEGVIKRLLEEMRPKDAFMVPVPEGVKPEGALASSELPLAIRMHPLHTNTSALFIACIGKKEL